MSQGFWTMNVQDEPGMLCIVRKSLSLKKCHYDSNVSQQPEDHSLFKTGKS